MSLIDVKNVSLIPLDLPDGRLVRPGNKAEGIDGDDPTVAAHLAAGGFLQIGDTDQDEATPTPVKRTNRKPKEPTS